MLVWLEAQHDGQAVRRMLFHTQSKQAARAAFARLTKSICRPQPGRSLQTVAKYSSLVRQRVVFGPFLCLEPFAS
jgi:hypothetical protein